MVTIFTKEHGVQKLAVGDDIGEWKITSITKHPERGGFGVSPEQFKELVGTHAFILEREGRTVLVANSFDPSSVLHCLDMTGRYSALCPAEFNFLARSDTVIQD